MSNWLHNNVDTLITAAVLVTFIFGAIMFAWGIMDWLSRRREATDTAHLMEPYTASGALDTTTQYFPQHLADHDEEVGPEVLDEHPEAYIGRHRLPENLSASQILALRTPTQGMPTLRTLAPSWRTEVLAA